jgi:FO synthase
VNDLGGTLMDENISRAAGAVHGQGLTEEDFRAIVEPIGRRLRRRDTLYGPAEPAGGVGVVSIAASGASEERNRPGPDHRLGAPG